METVTVSRRSLDEYVARLGQQEDQLAAAERRERALEERVVEYVAVISRLERELATMAENELPVGCEAAIGEVWVGNWRTRAQEALAAARVLVAA